MDVSDLWVFRIVPIDNLAYDLINGLHSQTSAKKSINRVEIGHLEIIEERSKRIVKCYPENVVNDFVPFYFSVRTPMLYNIITGHGVPVKRQEDIVYLCCRYNELANEEFKWCFTDGNAAKKITKFYTSADDLEKLDWRSINTEDFRSNNLDGDEDRIRKKHSEFLVYNHVPANKIKAIVVLNHKVKNKVKGITNSCNKELSIHINPKKQFYFL